MKSNVITRSLLTEKVFKTIYVYGDNEGEILTTIQVKYVPQIIIWKREEYFVWNSDLGAFNHPPDGMEINEYKGTFFIFYDQ